MKQVFTETDFSSLLLKLSLPLFVNSYVAIFAWFEPHVSYIFVSYKKLVILGHPVNQVFSSYQNSIIMFLDTD